MLVVDLVDHLQEVLHTTEKPLVLDGHLVDQEEGRHLHHNHHLVETLRM